RVRDCDHDGEPKHSLGWIRDDRFRDRRTHSGRESGLGTSGESSPGAESEMTETVRPPEVDRIAASRKAVAARRARASIKKDLATRVVTPQEVLRRAAADASSASGTLRVPEFLTSLPAIGQGKRDRILEELQIAPVKRLGGLGARQRAALEAWLDARFPEPAPRPGRSSLVVLAGPTAVGKGTVAAYIREHNPEVMLSVSATTRAPRPGEEEGRHYFFVD